MYGIGFVSSLSDGRAWSRAGRARKRSRSLTGVEGRGVLLGAALQAEAVGVDAQEGVVRVDCIDESAAECSGG